jgi:hypothetical protein
MKAGSLWHLSLLITKVSCIAMRRLQLGFRPLLPAHFSNIPADLCRFSGCHATVMMLANYAQTG